MKEVISFDMKKFFLILATLCFSIILFSIIGIVALYIWASRDLPNITKLNDYRPALATTVLARDGTLIGYFYREKRFLIPLSEMSEFLPKAFLAAEDAEFYEHEGVNPLAIFRAFLINLQSGTTRQGGSTITQQVIKRLLLTPERSYERKIKEAILAYRLEKYLSKDEILTIYLNQTFLGAQSYGVEAAARTYFAKHAKDLTLAEAALIAGLPQAPSRYNPYKDPDAAKNRQRYTLRRLREVGWITEAEYEVALQEPLYFSSMKEGVGSEASWYMEEVRRQLTTMLDRESLNRLGVILPTYNEDAIYELGLTIYTAMEPKAQIAAYDALRYGLENFSKRQGWQGIIEHISPAKLQEAIEHFEFTPETLNSGGWSKAIVTNVSPEGAEVSLGKYRGFISVKTMSWARKPNPEVRAAYCPAIKDARNVLAVGDVVWVSGLGVDEQTPYHAKDVTVSTPIPLALQQVPQIQGALISIEPKTGDVIAMIGGYEFGKSQFNRAVQSMRQPGSAFKPIVYSAALDHEYTPATMVLDAPIVEFMDSGDIWRPGNYEKNFDGPMLFSKALALSRNLCTVRIAQSIGIPAVIERARDLGFTSDFPEVFSISLGSIEVTPLSLANAYTAFANGGELTTPRFIISVEDYWGTTIYKQEVSHDLVISPQNAYIMSSLLKDVVNSGTARKAKVLERPLAGKTGTTNGENDAWFIGFTPYLVTCVYVGNDQPQTLGKDGTGAVAALPIFTDYSKIVLRMYPEDDFSVPDGITFASIDPQTGCLADSESLKSISLPFYVGTVPEPFVSKDKSTNPIERGEDLLKQFF